MYSDKAYIYISTTTAKIKNISITTARCQDANLNLNFKK